MWTIYRCSLYRGFMESDGRIIDERWTENDLEGTDCVLIQVQSRNLPRLTEEMTEETQICLYTCRDSNQALPDCKSEALPLDQSVWDEYQFHVSSWTPSRKRIVFGFTFKRRLYSILEHDVTHPMKQFNPSATWPEPLSLSQNTIRGLWAI
jgi:hypothetical protein